MQMGQNGGRRNLKKILAEYILDPGGKKEERNRERERAFNPIFDVLVFLRLKHCGQTDPPHKKSA